ncbi:Arm DNA-binding domain-containing protein, partial [Pseudomonas aeruginosa]|uniref:Arm DNA-binding domain-containing protein n=1 Tax=Pseudomonas aeruginosa TaxID=287 RepID=UPI001ADB632A
VCEGHDHTRAYQDGRGLILRIADTGRKSWVFRYSFHGDRTTSLWVPTLPFRCETPGSQPMLSG